MQHLSSIKKEERAEWMQRRMAVIVCADGRKRNALRKLSNEEHVQAFWRKVKKGSPDECWLWLGATCGSSGKYGSAFFQGKLVKAHRLAYELKYGPIPCGLIACHKCDTRLCVNPNHIFIGTQKDNMVDMHRKGRANHRSLLGEENPRSKITIEQVKKVKQLWSDGASTQREIAFITGVSKTNVGAILQGRTWRGVH